MAFTYEFIVDPANKILICEVFGETQEIVDLEHMLKTVVKMAGKNQVKNVVLDSTQFKLLFSTAQMAKLLITVQENGWLGGLKVARIVNTEINIENVVEVLAESLSLSVKNFETRSEAMLWLLFDKLSD
ncbi:hypothetical protein [Paraglaciecola arctica]|uniref:hypothetical protein n=1 Tax=Paraglaciecola arctica TaxID=1128911 RepID=UPI0020911E4B|nr:hypothetical protein [Paraglaciecola arctica]